MEFLVLRFLLVDGGLVSGRSILSVVGWSMDGGWWSVVGGRLISAFKETL